MELISFNSMDSSKVEPMGGLACGFECGGYGCGEGCDGSACGDGLFCPGDGSGCGDGCADGVMCEPGAL